MRLWARDPTLAADMRVRRANLELKYFGLSDSDLQTRFIAGKFIGRENATLAEIIKALQDVYTSAVGVQYSYINDQVKVDWVQEEIEKKFSPPFDVAKKKRILEKLGVGPTVYAPAEGDELSDEPIGVDDF